MNDIADVTAALRENDRFLAALAKSPRPLLRGMAGAHAAFTLSEETAEALAKRMSDLAQPDDL